MKQGGGIRGGERDQDAGIGVRGSREWRGTSRERRPLGGERPSSGLFLIPDPWSLVPRSSLIPLAFLQETRPIPIPVPAPLPDTTIRHAVDAVFRAPAFNRYSLWQKFIGWLSDLWGRLLALLDPLFSSLRSSPPLFWTVVIVLAGVVVAIIGRAVYLWYARRSGAAAARPHGGAPHLRYGSDPWAAAQELAARGEFTEAAHALYAALLESAARQQQIRLHPSKTLGDYVRELRGRSSELFTRFREFARSYEVVIYGIGHCDESRYQRLYALAIPIVHPHE
jgi:hypothetical protein